MMDRNNIPRYIFAIVVILIATFVGNKVKEYLDSGPNGGDMKLIREYLLDGDSAGAGGLVKPLIWIHTNYERNARVWESFGSRTSYDLNQPYIHMCIKTIVKENSRDFNICLIDDYSFARLIPEWKIDMEITPEPFRAHVRTLGLLKLVYLYGGMVVPNSFLCLTSLKQLYDRQERAIPFVAENISTWDTTAVAPQNIDAVGVPAAARNNTYGMIFAPDVRFFGARGKKNAVIAELIKSGETLYYNGHFTAQHIFMGTMSQFCVAAIHERRMKLLSGQYTGVMTMKKEPARIDNWMVDSVVPVSPHIIGIWIDADEILRRPKYQWFSVVPIKDILNDGDYALAEYFRMAAERMLERDGARGGCGCGCGGGRGRECKCRDCK